MRFLISVIDDMSNSGTDAPLFAAKEQFSGFWVIEANDETTARTLAHGGSKACNRKVELRPLL